eukprot:51836_1
MGTSKTTSTYTGSTLKHKAIIIVLCWIILILCAIIIYLCLQLNDNFLDYFTGLTLPQQSILIEENTFNPFIKNNKLNISRTGTKATTVSEHYSDSDLLSFLPTQLISELNINGYIDYNDNTAIFRKSRPVIGDVSYFSCLFHKILIKKECISTLVIGGSVSAPAQGIEQQKQEKWWRYFNDWLNVKYPCNNSNNSNNGVNGQHQIVSKAVGSTGSDFVLDHFDRFETEHKHFDIIFIEYAINDVGPLRRYDLKNFSLEYEVSRISEKLVRMLLSLYKVHQPLVAYIEMGWHRGIDGHGSTEYFQTAVFEHQKIAFYYQIPMISLVHVMLPIHIFKFCSKYRTHPKQKCPQNRKWFEDQQHPTVDGHKLMAILIAYNFHLEQVNADRHQQITDYNTSMYQNYLPKPWILTQKEAGKEAENYLIPIHSLDFTDTVMYDEFIVYNNGWSHDFETSKKKYGFIANATDSLIIFKVNATKSIHIWYLKTYENIGSVIVWISNQKTNNMTDMKWCSNVFPKKQANKYDKIVNIDGYHPAHTSIYHSTPIQISNNSDGKTQTFYVHICVASKQKHGTKFKLLQILTF